MNCESCGASMAPNAAECPYCHTTTAFGHHQAHQRAAWEQQQAAQHAAQAAHHHQQTRQQREWHLRSRASSLWLWGLFALFVPCFGVPALIAALVAWGVRAEAKRENLPVPGQVTTTLVLSGLGFALSFAFVITGQLATAEYEERLAKVERRAKPLADKPMLDQHDACSLAEWTILRDGHDGIAGQNFEHFRCDGRLLITAPEKLMLEAMRFKKDAAERTVDVCFVRRARWTVERVVAAGAGCDAPPPGASEPAVTGAAAPAAAPSPTGTLRDQRR